MSQKLQNLVNLSVGSVFFSRSRPVWESNFCKIEKPLLGERDFYFGGELVVFSRILAFFVTFDGRLPILGRFAREVSQISGIRVFSREVSQKVANDRTSQAKVAKKLRFSPSMGSRFLQNLRENRPET